MSADRQPLDAATNQLLWDLAEAEDSDAIKAFINERPDLTSELEARMRMVGELKRSKPTPPPQEQPAHFEPPRRRRPQPATSALPPGVLALVGGSTLFALAALGVYVVQQRQQPVMNPPLVGETVPAPTLPDSGMPPVGMPPAAVDPLAPRAPQNPPPDPSSQPRETMNMDRLISARYQGVPLQAVIAQLCTQVGVSAQFAPNMENPMIDAQYDQIPLREALQDLSRSFGFSFFEQGPTQVLVIPAVDNSSVQGTPGNNVPPGSGTMPNDPRVLPSL